MQTHSWFWFLPLGRAVDSHKEMLGTFSPQPEPYTYVTPEETTPSGMFARGSYSARTKVRMTRIFFVRYQLLQETCKVQSLSNVLLIYSCSSSTTTGNVTWRSTTPSTYAESGRR